jgi:hypothetical protein
MQSHPDCGGPVPHLPSLQADFLSGVERLEGVRARLPAHELRLRIPAKSLAMLLLPLTLAACLDSEDTRTMSFVENANAEQPFPANYKPEILAFFKTYLNNPVGVHEAVIAAPVQRTVGGRARYVACLRFAERQPDGTYREPRERAVLFVGGRLDRIIPNAAEDCTGAAYAAFPEMEKLTR